MQRGGDPLILCFVDFVNAACAATAMSALQGDHYTFLLHSLQYQCWEIKVYLIIIVFSCQIHLAIKTSESYCLLL
jgi:hypothetical protein